MLTTLPRGLNPEIRIWKSNAKTSTADAEDHSTVALVDRRGLCGVCRRGRETSSDSFGHAHTVAYLPAYGAALLWVLIGYAAAESAQDIFATDNSSSFGHAVRYLHRLL
jgi:hypothetical protein